MGPTFQKRESRRLVEAARFVRIVMDEPSTGHSGSRWVVTPVVGLELYRGTTRTGSPVSRHLSRLARAHNRGTWTMFGGRFG